MKQKRIALLMLISGLFVLCWNHSTFAQEKPLPGGVPGPGWIEHTASNDPYYTYYTINYATHRDWNEGEKIQITLAYLAQYGSHIQGATYDSCTYTYNCHSYVFISSDGWLESPEPFFSDFFYLEGPGGIYSWGDTHSATAGSGEFMYCSKLSALFTCYHDDELPWGAHDRELCNWNQ